MVGWRASHASNIALQIRLYPMATAAEMAERPKLWAGVASDMASRAAPATTMPRVSKLVA